MIDAGSVKLDTMMDNGFILGDIVYFNVFVYHNLDALFIIRWPLEFPPQDNEYGYIHTL